MPIVRETIRALGVDVIVPSPATVPTRSEPLARGPSVGDPLYKELTEEWEQALREMKSAISAVIELLRVE